MTALLLFFIVLGTLVVVHELGHFWAARLSGVKVEEFGVGFPPKAWSYKPKGSEVEYSINWLPLGGFVKIFGENYEQLEEGDVDNSRSFVNARKYKQIFILIAGVTMNFLAAIFLFSAAAWTGSFEVALGVADRDGFIVAGINPGSPADNAGLMVGDKILAIESGGVIIQEADLQSGSFISTIANVEPGESLTIDVAGVGSNDVVIRQVTITPETGLILDDPDRPAIGVYADSLKFSRAGFIEGLEFGISQSVTGVISIANSFGNLISSAFNGSGAENLKNLAGPVGIAQMSAQAYDIGLGSLFSFAAFLSLNLVVLNLLPIPALDGGRILFVLIEKIKGSRISATMSGYTNLVGFGLIILLMIFVTFQDIVRLF